MAAMATPESCMRRCPSYFHGCCASGASPQTPALACSGRPAARTRAHPERAEIAAFWRGCECIGPPFGPLFQFMLITGCSLARGRPHDTRRAGRGRRLDHRRRPHEKRSLAYLAVAAAGARDLASVPVIEGEPVISSPPQAASRSPPSLAAKKLLDAAIAKSAGHAVEFRLHDLRRTAATKLAALGSRCR